MANTQEFCYDISLPEFSQMPTNYEHNCKLWQADHSPGVYVTNVAMRKVANIAGTALSAICSYNIWNSNFKIPPYNLLAKFGILISPILVFTKNLPLVANDVIYLTTGTDLIQHFTEDVNSVLTYMWGLPEENAQKELKAEMIFKSTVISPTEEGPQVEEQADVNISVMFEDVGDSNN